MHVAYSLGACTRSAIPPMSFPISSGNTRPTRRVDLDDLSADFVDESSVLPLLTTIAPMADLVARHIEAFANALQADDIHDEPYDSSQSLLTPTSSRTSRVRKVSALSDFAPINQKVKRYASRIETILRDLTPRLSGEQRETEWTIEDMIGSSCFSGGHSWYSSYNTLQERS